MSAKLALRRDVLKGLIKRTLVFTNNIPDEFTSRALKTKLEILDNNYRTCFNTHLEVMELTGPEGLELQEIEFESIQTMYETAKTRILERNEDLDDADESEADYDRGEMPPPARAEVKLPFIKIPSFSGDYSTWKSFRDLFLSSIGNRRDVAGAQKLQYLNSFLDGEAAQLVRKFAVSDENYRNAWAALDLRYNNKRLLMNAHFKRFFGQNAVLTESASLLRGLLNKTTECVESLKALNLPTEHWDAVVVYVVSQRLDAETQKQWEVSLTENDIPSFEKLVLFIEKRCRSLETYEAMRTSMATTTTVTCKRTLAAGAAATSAANPSRTSHRTTPQIHHASANAFSACAVCGQGHSVSNCMQFKSMHVKDRHETVKNRRLCFVCLKHGHVSSNCTQSKCATCSGKHHELLHFATSSITPAAVDSTSANTNAVAAQFCAFLQTPVLLPTAVVKVNDSSERVRVLLDSGAVSCLILESCVQRLGLQRTKVEVPVSGFGGVDAGTSTSMVNIVIRSCVNETSSFPVTALVLRNLTGHLPNKRVTLPLCAEINKLPLADPTYFEPSNVEMIIGSKLVFFVLREGRREGCIEPGREVPTLQNSAFGWLITGAAATVENGPRLPVTGAMSFHADVEPDLRRFWEIEEVSGANLLSDEEKLCEAHFTATHARDTGGRYVVRLPFSSEPSSQLGDSRVAAERRLRHIERRLSANRDLQNQYRSFMEEYAEMGHMRLAARPASATTYYLPHHFVVKESSSTTRLRVVFDASCKTTTGRSLNDVQMVGPRLQSDLAAIIMRFRRHAVALTADIAKMYRQVRVDEADLDYQRILWRSDPADEIQEWQLTTVTYGMAASPFLAVRALQQLAQDEQQTYPMASHVVMSDFYVDDVITGCDSSDEAMALQKELCELMACGGMELRKWSTNCQRTRNSIPEALRECGEPLRLEDESPVKTLGLRWYPAADCFAFRVTPPVCDARVTKRAILSVVARLFDPLGLLAPSIIVAKMIIQQLWTSGLAWDDEVPDVVRKTWLKYHNTLTSLERLQFPRWIGAQRGVNLQLHGFADASESAYGGVIYARCQMPDGDVRVSLLTAKTKVAPLKQVTLPRLELCAAMLVTNLLQTVLKTYELDATKCFLWSDSQVTLGWIRKAPRSWKTFVANRVSAIQSIAPPDRWRYVPTAENPADCLSRGLMPLELRTCAAVKTSLDERAAASALVVNCEDDGCVWMQRFSSLPRMQRVTAWMRRFALNSRRPSSERVPSAFVTVPEMRGALMLCVKRVQAAVYADEIRCCLRKTNLPKSSKLISLTPFLDDEGVLRLGGRLRNAYLTDDEMHPAILPSHDHLTSLIIADAHTTLLHGGVQIMLHYVRQKFWIVGARGQIRRHVHNCMVCFRQRPRSGVQQMGDLPRDRVTPSRAFAKSGVDYAGPFSYKSRAGRGWRTEKGYAALFVCLSTRAIHLEFVSELTAAAFLGAFRRFVARRGKCCELMSDNATNFVGARRELRDILQSHSEEVERVLANDGTVWRTIPPRSPHFGGLWEAGVKAVKHHLVRIVGQQLLTFEEFATMLAEIEAVLDLRPLCALSDDPHDLTALTPGHFLVGSPPVVVPERELVSVPINRLSRWQLVSQMAQHFWRRWRREYLSTLQQRFKWTETSPNATIGKLVLLKDELHPDMHSYT